MENIQNRQNEFSYPVHLYMVTESIFVCSENEPMTRKRLRNSIGIVMRMIYFHQFYQRTPLEVSETSLSSSLIKQREQTARGIILRQKQFPKTVGKYTNRVHACYTRDKVKSYLFPLGSDIFLDTLVIIIKHF